VMQLLVVVDIHRNNEHCGGGGDAHDESKIGNIDSPRNLIAHPGGDQSMGELPAIRVEPKENNDQQPASPGEITPIADKSDASATREKGQIIFDGLGHRKFEI